MGFHLFPRPHTRFTGSGSQSGEVPPLTPSLGNVWGGLGYDNHKKCSWHLVSRGTNSHAPQSARPQRLVLLQRPTGLSAGKGTDQNGHGAMHGKPAQGKYPTELDC